MQKVHFKAFTHKSRYVSYDITTIYSTRYNDYITVFIYLIINIHMQFIKHVVEDA